VARTTLAGEFRTWSGEHDCRAAVVARPRTVEEVAAAVRAAQAAGRRVRVAGAGHSFSPLVPTDGMLLRLDALDRVLEVDRERGLARVQAGIRLHALSDALATHGLALPNLGDVDRQSLAGALATGTHGTGARLPILSAQAVAFLLVGADGELLRIDEGAPELLAAARVALGALGVVCEVTLRCVPAFALRRVDAPRPLGATLDGLDELAAAADHVELFAFPWARDALTRTTTRLPRPPAPPGALRRAWEDVALANGAFGLSRRLGRARPAWRPAINRALVRAAGTTVREDRSDRIFATPRLVRFTESEHAVPAEAAASAARAVLRAAERHGIGFPVEVRLSAADDALLSPAHGRATAWVAAHVERGTPPDAYLREVQAIADAHDGRPHWGKRHGLDAAALEARLPAFARFRAVRDALDPERRFQNAELARVLGP
jgi:L-gulonolactone oxidase